MTANNCLTNICTSLSVLSNTLLRHYFRLFADSTREGRLKQDYYEALFTPLWCFKELRVSVFAPFPPGGGYFRAAASTQSGSLCFDRKRSDCRPKKGREALSPQREKNWSPVGGGIIIKKRKTSVAVVTIRKLVNPVFGFLS